MVDTVNFRLAKYDVQSADFMKRTPYCLNDVGVHSYANGTETITGTLGNLKVSVNPDRVTVRDGSLCKWYLGDNYQTMTRRAIQQAIECLSDTLHLPMDKATVTRLDVATNIMVQHPVGVYIDHLGGMKYAQRLLQPNGLYYDKSNQQLVFYDKNRQQRRDREKIPELYQDKNVLRIEQRHIHNVGKQFGVAAVTGAMLYNEKFYIRMLQQWREAYARVDKINDKILNFEAMKGKRQLYDMGLLALVEKVGGELAIYSQISEAQKRGELTSKQAFDIRKTIKAACELGKGLTVKNEAIAELDKKVKQSTEYYR